MNEHDEPSITKLDDLESFWQKLRVEWFNRLPKHNIRLIGTINCTHIGPPGFGTESTQQEITI